MNPINNILLLSLKHDLKSINSINLKILQHLPSFQLKSWLFPTKKGIEVNNGDPNEVGGDNQYLKLLEYIVEKLYLMINLMVNFLDKKFRRQLSRRNIEAPNNLSLGGASKLLWQQLEGLKYAHADKSRLVPVSNEMSSYVSDDKYSQTAFEPISCKNCALSINCIKTVVNELENHACCTLIGEIRQNLKEDIYNTSQYGCLTRISEGIVDEIRKQMSRFETLQNQHTKVNRILDEKSIKYKQSMNLIKETNQSLQKVTTLSKNKTLKNKSLTKTISDLRQAKDEQENEMKYYKQQIQLLKQSVETHTADLALMTTDNQLLQLSLKRIRLEMENVEKESKIWRTRFNDMHSENERLIVQVKSLEKSHIFRNSMDKIIDTCQRHCEKLQDFNVEIQNKSRNLESLAEIIVDIVDSQKISRNEVSDQFKSDVQRFTGNPLSDMTQQVQMNRASIKQLEDDNRKLLQTIQKIQGKFRTN